MYRPLYQNYTFEMKNKEDADRLNDLLLFCKESKIFDRLHPSEIMCAEGLQAPYYFENYFYSIIGLGDISLNIAVSKFDDLYVITFIKNARKSSYIEKHIRFKFDEVLELMEPEQVKEIMFNIDLFNI